MIHLLLAIGVADTLSSATTEKFGVAAGSSAENDTPGRALQTGKCCKRAAKHKRKKVQLKQKWRECEAAAEAAEAAAEAADTSAAADTAVGAEQSDHRYSGVEFRSSDCSGATTQTWNLPSFPFDEASADGTCFTDDGSGSTGNEWCDDSGAQMRVKLVYFPGVGD